MSELPGIPSVPVRLHEAPDAMSGVRRAAEQGRVEEAAKAFETYFASLLVREMRRSLPEGLVGSGIGTDVYGAWFDEHVGRALADSRGIGIQQMLQPHIQRMGGAEPSERQVSE
jgi:Rod binding domain-containing protein